MRVILIRSTSVMPDPPVEKMANTLLKLGHTVTILAWDRDDTYSEKCTRKTFGNNETDIIHFGIPAEYSGGIKKNLKGLALFQIRIMKWLISHRKEYDTVHAFDFDTGFAAMMCCKVLGKKFIYHILDYYVEGHILPGKSLNAVIEFLEIRVINAADYTILCTEKRKEQISRAKPKEIAIIHNTPDSIQRAEAMSLQKGKRQRIKIVYVGILAGLRLLKESIEVISQMDDVEMHIGGFGEYEDWMREAADKYENIFFYGKLQYGMTLGLEKQCDIMLAMYDPSLRNHKYAAPNKFYEAVMLGKPIIMAYDTGYDEVITANNIGVLTEYSKPGIACAIRELAARQEEWFAMGERAKQVYMNDYSWNIMQHRIDEIYKNINGDS